VSVRVLTINLWGRSGDWASRRSVIKKALAELAPDLIAFQESFVIERYDQIAELTDEFHVVHQKNRAPDGGGISVASRMPIQQVHELDLHLGNGPREFAAGAVMVEVEAPEPLLFVNHFPSWQLNQESEREQQAVTVAREIERLTSGRTAHVVVAGDMDADPAATSIRFWTGRTSLGGMSVSYRDAWEARHPDEPGETFTPHNPLVADPDWPFRRIDYIFVRCGLHGGPTLQIERCERWLDEPVNGVWASDHFGMVAELV
jgi:endonuclease/exonuclease/phosphatase family metal-dependent hydrolase